MDENTFNVGVGFIPDLSTIDKASSILAAAFEKGTRQGVQKGLIQGIDGNSISRPLGIISAKANEFEKSMAAANARVIAFGASVAPIFAIRAAFDKLLESTIDVERSITNINAIFGLGSSNLRTFTAQLFNVANQTGQSFNMASEAATEFARQGLSVEETLKRTSAALILNKISGLAVGEAVSSITSILNGFNKEALTSTDIINRMTAVDTQFAVSAGDLAEALKRVGATASDSNVSLNQTLALITAAKQITGREGSTIGNSLKTIFTRIERPAVLNQLEEVGIKAKDSNGKLLPTIDILKNIANSYQTLSEGQKSFVSETIGGVYQVNILKAILKDSASQISIVDRAFQAAENSTNAVQTRMAKLNDTLSAGLVRTMNDLTLATSNVGQALIGSPLKNGINSFDNLLKTTAEKTNPDNKSPSAQVVQAGIKGLGNFLAGPGLQVGINIILKLLNTLIDFSVKSGKDLLGLDAGMKERQALESAYLKILTEEREVMNDLVSGKKSIAQFTQETISSSLINNQKQNLAKEFAGAATGIQLKNSSFFANSKANTSIPNLALTPNLKNSPVNYGDVYNGEYSKGKSHFKLWGTANYRNNGNFLLNNLKSNSNDTSHSFEEVLPEFIKDLKALGQHNIEYTPITDDGRGNARRKLFDRWIKKHSPDLSNLSPAVQDALNRENLATGGHGQISRSNSLITSENPLGLVAIDSRSQTNGDDAVQQHRQLGQSLTQIKKPNTNIPNLATNVDLSILLSSFGYLAQLGNSSENIQKFINLTPQLFSVTQKEIYSKRQLVNEFDKMSRTLLTTGKPQSFYGASFNNVGEIAKSPLLGNIESYRKQVGDFDAENDQKRKSIWSTGFKIANWSSFGGGIASQIASNVSPTSAASVDALQAGAMSAGQALIAFPNKIGMALSIGLAGTGIFNAIDVWSKGIENASAAADVELSRLKNLNENLRSLSQTSSNLNNLYLDASSSIESISRESRKYSETLINLSQIPGGKNIVRKIESAPDSDSRQSAIQNALAEQGKREETVASLNNIQKFFAQKTFLGLNHVPGLQENSGFSYSQSYDKDAVQSQLNEAASISIANMDNDFKNTLSDSVTNLSQFNEILNKFTGEDANAVRDYLNKIKQSGGGDAAYNQVIQQIRTRLSQNIINKNPDFTSELKSSREKLSNSQLNIDDSIKQKQYIERLFLNKGAIQTDNLLDVRQASSREEYNKGLTKISGYEYNSNLFEQTNGEKTVAKRNYNINIEKATLETKNSLNNLNVETNKNLISSISQSFDKLFKNNDLAQNINGETNVSIGESNANLIQAINTGLAKTINDSKGDILGKFKDNNGQFNFQKFAEITGKNSSDNTVIQSKIEKYLNSQQSIDILKTLNNSSNKQVEILQEFKTKSIEEQQKYNAAIKEANFKQQIGYLGGIQSLLSRETARTYIRDISRGTAMMSNPNGSSESKAMGATLLLDTFQKMNVNMDKNYPIINKAFGIGAKSGSETFNKYGTQLIGSIRNDSDAKGILQVLGQITPSRVMDMLNAKYKPENNPSYSSEKFIDTNTYLKNFDSGLDEATKSLLSFPKTIQATIQDLQSANKNVTQAKEDYNKTALDNNKKLENIQKTIEDKYKDNLKGGEANQQTDYLGNIKGLITPIVSGIGFALGSLLVNRGGNIAKSTGVLVKNLFNGKNNTIDNTLGNELKNGIQNNKISGNNLIKNYNKTDKPMGWEYEAPKPTGWEYETSQTVKKIPSTPNIYNSVVGKLGSVKLQINKIEEQLIQSQQAIDDFTKSTFKKMSQQLKIGSKTGNSYVDSIFTGNYKDTDRKFLETQLKQKIPANKLSGGQGLLQNQENLAKLLNQKTNEQAILKRYVQKSKISPFSKQSMNENEFIENYTDSIKGDVLKENIQPKYTQETMNILRKQIRTSGGALKPYSILDSNINTSIPFQNLFKKIPGFSGVGGLGKGLRFGGNLGTGAILGAAGNFAIDKTIEKITGNKGEIYNEDKVGNQSKQNSLALFSSLIGKSLLGARLGGGIGAVSTAAYEFGKLGIDWKSQNLDYKNEEQKGKTLDFQRTLNKKQLLNSLPKEQYDKIIDARNAKPGNIQLNTDKQLKLKQENKQKELIDLFYNNNDTAQGRARNILQPLKGAPLQSLRPEERKNLEGVYRAIHPEDKKGGGFNNDFIKYFGTDKGYTDTTKKLESYYSKTLPSLIPGAKLRESDIPSQKEAAKITEATQPLVDGLNNLTNAIEKNANINNKNSAPSPITFSTLPINITVTSAKDSGNAVVDAINKSLQDLIDRVSKLDGKTSPALVG